VVRVEPLRYAVLHTAAGPMTAAFYYDVAPNTVHNFLSLAEGGYFDGLTFHRIVPGFVIQGGDPRGDGTGGPGYMIDAEFSDPKNNRSQHEAGALSMARTGDPGEGPGVMPRPEFANSAGSQFFVCLDYANTKQLDGKYTVFGRVVGGMEAVNKIAAAPLADTRSGMPEKPQVIERVEVKPVVPAENPYGTVLKPRAVTP
jgi:peptidyl-prolyl cis-trans isomerase B (cyclophilin B)